MPLKLLYVPNEHGESRQFGIRNTLAHLKSVNLIADVRIFSLLWRIREGSTPSREISGLIELSRKEKPDILFLQHLGGTGLTESSFRTLRRNCGKIVYHEADPYTKYFHPLPREARSAGRHADVVFTVGNGAFADNFRRAGAADVRWEPSIFDPGRFGSRPPNRNSRRRFDIVMIANRNVPRLRGLPNWRDRIRYVEYLEARFGNRFAIFGNGWTGKSAQGPIPYSQQQSALAAGWISTNWDHFAKEPQYFSDRLPTSMASGSVHATTEHPGFSEIFPNTESFLFASANMVELADLAESYLRNTSIEERHSREVSAWKFAHSRLRQDDQFIRMLNSVGADIDRSAYQKTRALPFGDLQEL